MQFPGLVIKRNSSHTEAVWAIQQRLNELGCGPVQVDGIFGSGTEAAVRLFQEVRGRRNLTYAVHAPLVDRGIVAGGLYVTTVAPDEVLRIMREEVTRLQTELIDARALPEMVGLFLTDYFLDNETNAAQADFLARAQLYKGNYEAADGFVRSLREVSNEDIRRVARQYMRNMHWAYVGDPGEAPRQGVLRF